MPPVFETSATTAVDGSGTFSLPSGVTSTDLLVAQFEYSRAFDGGLSMPSGWTLITNQWGQEGTASLVTAWAQGGVSAPNFGVARRNGCIYRISGVDLTDPIAENASGGESGPNSPITIGQITPPVDDTLLVIVGSCTRGSGTLTLSGPSGTTQRFALNTQFGFGNGVIVGGTQPWESGATGTRTISWSPSQGGDNHAWQVLAIRGEAAEPDPIVFGTATGSGVGSGRAAAILVTTPPAPPDLQLLTNPLRVRATFGSNTSALRRQRWMGEGDPE